MHSDVQGRSDSPQPLPIPSDLFTRKYPRPEQEKKDNRSYGPGRHMAQHGHCVCTGFRSAKFTQNAELKNISCQEMACEMWCACGLSMPLRDRAVPWFHRGFGPPCRGKADPGGPNRPSGDATDYLDVSPQLRIHDDIWLSLRLASFVAATSSEHQPLSVN